MPAEFARLQEATSISANTTQDRRDALDAARKTQVAVQVVVLQAAAAGTLVIQHAAVLEEAAFEDSSFTVSLANVGPKTVLVTGHTRYLRWKASAMSGTAVFRIDTIGRE